MTTEDGNCAEWQGCNAVPSKQGPSAMEGTGLGASASNAAMRAELGRDES